MSSKTKFTSLEGAQAAYQAIFKPLNAPGRPIRSKQFSQRLHNCFIGLSQIVMLCFVVALFYLTYVLSPGKATVMLGTIFDFGVVFALIYLILNNLEKIDDTYQYFLYLICNPPIESFHNRNFAHFGYLSSCVMLQHPHFRQAFLRWIGERGEHGEHEFRLLKKTMIEYHLVGLNLRHLILYGGKKGAEKQALQTFFDQEYAPYLVKTTTKDTEYLVLTEKEEDKLWAELKVLAKVKTVQKNLDDSTPLVHTNKPVSRL